MIQTGSQSISNHDIVIAIPQHFNSKSIVVELYDWACSKSHDWYSFFTYQSASRYIYIYLSQMFSCHWLSTHSWSLSMRVISIAKCKLAIRQTRRPQTWFTYEVCIQEHNVSITPNWHGKWSSHTSAVLVLTDIESINDLLKYVDGLQTWSQLTLTQRYSYVIVSRNYVWNKWHGACYAGIFSNHETMNGHVRKCQRPETPGHVYYSLWLFIFVLHDTNILFSVKAILRPCIFTIFMVIAL